MKKKLSQAIAAAALLGAAGAAQAVEISHGGEGQALLFPYYTVENNNYTALHLTNTTDDYKAVKVRFRRFDDSADVLDFNLYLSPKDMWTGAVVLGAKGVSLVGNDTSCISGMPNGRLPEGGQVFGVQSGALKGHIEVIEMANWTQAQAEASYLDDAGTVNVATAVKHKLNDAGEMVPGNCDAITSAWQQDRVTSTPIGKWATLYANNAADNIETYFDVREEDGLGYAPTGGIYGNAYVINPDAAWSSSFAPVALNALYDGTAVHNHHAPRYSLPDLHGSDFTGITAADLIIADPEWSDTQYDQAIAQYENFVNFNNAGMVVAEDIAAALSKTSIKSDFTLGGASQATTELVVTFPVKYAGNPVDNVEVGATFYDREESIVLAEVGDWQLSPWLPPEDAKANSLVHETNVVHLGAEGDNVEIGEQTMFLNSPFQEGWVNINFVEGAVPVIGFTSTLVKNETILGNGGINTYALNFPLKYTEE